MLLKAGEKGVERKKLIEFLRPEETDVMKGLNNLRQQIFLLRRVLRQSDCPEGKYIVPKDSRYYFSLEYSLETDTGQLDQLAYRIRNETMDEEEKKQVLLQYCQTYTGEFLPMLGGEEWVALESAYYQKQYFSFLSELCTILKKQGEIEKILELCTRASEIHPYDEWQAVQIDCLMSMNRYREALKVYEKATEIFYEDLGVTSIDKVMAKYRNLGGQLYYAASAMTGIKEVLQEDFGFTDADVDEMLAFYGLTAYKNVIRDWYDGYLFGKASVYCPWDVINYCDVLMADKDAEPENYWANTSGNEIVRRLLNQADQTARDEIGQLINGGTIIKSIRQELTYRDIEDSIDNVWSVLYSTGYLTQRGRLPGKQMKLTLPNHEVKELFIDLVKTWFKETTWADSSRINRFCGAFPAGDVSAIQEMLHDYLWDSISVRDTAVRTNRKENFYHGMLLGLLQSQGSWFIRSNKELGEGYSDLSICTPDRIGIVIELKYADDGRLESACAEALKQIEERKYAVRLQQKGMKKILKYGMAFCEKECMVVLA